MTEYIVVLVTVSSPEEGDRIARALVEERLAACVNQAKAIQSTYRWQGRIERSEEELLIIKGMSKKKLAKLRPYLKVS